MKTKSAAAAYTLLLAGNFVAAINSNIESETDTPSTAAPPTITSWEPVSNPTEAASREISVVAIERSSLYRPPIPIPSDAPNADILAQLAPLWPAVQALPGDGSVQKRHESIDWLAMLRPPPPSPENSSELSVRQSELKIMIVGDSITHGADYDYTWRYRIWQWLRGQNVPFQFSGPYIGTQQGDVARPPQPPPLYGSTDSGNSLPRTNGRYASDVDQAFLRNSRHFAVWGRAAATDRGLIAGVVRDNPTDVMLIMLGFNDLGWFYSGPQGTLESVKAIVDNARGVNPNMKFVIANIIYRTDLGRKDLPKNTDTYNEKLKAAIPRWSTGQSPIAMADVRGSMSCELSSCPAAYDGLHPNALGDYQIAQAFSKGLIELQIGQRELAVPGNIPARSLPAPSGLRADTAGHGATAYWDVVPGAHGYDIESRIVGVTDWAPGSVQVNRYDQRWPFDGKTYEFRVRAKYGSQTGAWAGPVSVVARPQTPTAPEITGTPTANGMEVSWNPATGPYSSNIVVYQLIWWDKDTSCVFIQGAGFKSSPARIGDLKAGNRYLLGMSVWNNNGEGWPYISPDLKVGAGAPGPPTNLNIKATDGASIGMSWTVNTNAAGYKMWIRNHVENGQFQELGSVQDNCATSFFLFPGTWNYEVCIASTNGKYVSSRTCAKCPRPPARDEPPPTCPGPREWCPPGQGQWGPEPEDPNLPDTTDPGAGMCYGKPIPKNVEKKEWYNPKCGNTVIYVDDVVTLYGSLTADVVFDALKENCRSGQCYDFTLPYETTHENGGWIQKGELHVKPTASYDNTIDISKLIEAGKLVVKEGKYGRKETWRGCDVPCTYSNTCPSGCRKEYRSVDRYYFPMGIAIRVLNPADGDIRQFLNVQITQVKYDEPGACETILTAGSAVAGAINGAAGGVFAIGAFLCGTF